MSFAQKIAYALIGLLVLVGSLIGLFSYQITYRQVEESAGVETVGCANITTGLFDSGDIERLVQGDTSGLAELETRLNWTVAHKPLFKESFLMSLDGTILAADENVKARGYQAGDTFYFSDKDREMIASMKHSVYTKVYEYDGAKLLSGYGPIYKNHDPKQEIVGLMVINFDASIISDRTRDILLLPFMIGAIVFVLAVLFVYFFIHRMIRPLEKLSKQVERVAQGDLTVQPLLIKSEDEVGRLTRSFAEMISSLRELITEVNDTSMQVASSSEQLSASAEQTGTASEHSVNISQALAQGAELQLQNLESGSMALHEMSSRIGHIAQHAVNVSGSAQQASSASDQGALAIRSSMQQMATMESKIVDLSSTIEELSSHSKEVQSILDIMTEIAAETNLLALNASIEAARAGEYGSGFAVVASSVRKLAERSTASAQQIAELVALIVQRMELAGVAMDETVHEVKRGSELVQRAGDSFGQIEEAAQSTAQAITDVSESVNLLAEGSDKLVASIDEIVRFANETVSSAQNMSASSQEQLASIQEVDASANLLSSLAEKLHELIERFKVV
ncbi:methyl-accepting chemotaxis protein [Paenibacillus senegalimassiliensis]|uniref:methyl-accepting chemotaxis protein n=1 Tax=Paenibacillus senegalimassiliensis TaxID=1737426 RepID=UPI00073F6A7B|nr:methyl-accepting chemotaxis protein [Paenibacillus senegalimassiliensis]